MPIRSEIEEVQSSAAMCVTLAKQVMDAYEDINRMVSIYEDSINTLKKILVGDTSLLKLNESVDTAERNAAIFQLAALDLESTQLKRNLALACSKLMGELGNNLDSVRICLNSLIIDFDKSLIPTEHISLLISISKEIDIACSNLGNMQFPNTQIMKKYLRQ